MTASYFSSGSLLIAAVAAPGLWATGALFLMVAIPIGIVNVLFFSMVQSALDDAFLGRVTSLMRSVLSGIAPAGGLLGGAVAGVAGSVTTLYGMGSIVAVIGAYYLLHPRLRSLPSVTETNEAVLGIRSATNETRESIGTEHASE